jgi:hypothetical protein
MAQDLVRVPKLGNPSPYVCSQCDKRFANRTPEDQNRIHRHLILHVPDSTMRWSLMDEWAAQDRRDEPANSAFA